MNIDKIFVINLEYRTDRKKQMIKELEKHNITNYEFFKAVRPNHQDIIEWNNNYCHKELKIFKKRPKKFLNYQIGCLGCLKSHLEVCKLALERNYKNILILEDDTEFIYNLKTLYKFSSQINNNYDMLYLCGSHLGTKEKISENIIKVKGTYTTGSYLIRENVMKFLVKNIQSYSKKKSMFFIHKKFKQNLIVIVQYLTLQNKGQDIQTFNKQMLITI